METSIPKHIAIIMDGNGRWAKEKGKLRVEGHKKGAENIEKIIDYSIKLGVKYLTVYAFSTENWKRPEAEVKALMKLFAKYLDDKKEELKKQGVKLLVTGTEENIPNKLLKKIRNTEEYLSDCNQITFNIAFNYGGRKETEVEEAKLEKLKEEKDILSANKRIQDNLTKIRIGTR